MESDRIVLVTQLFVFDRIKSYKYCIGPYQIEWYGMMWSEPIWSDLIQSDRRGYILKKLNYILTLGNQFEYTMSMWYDKARTSGLIICVKHEGRRTYHYTNVVWNMQEFMRFYIRLFIRSNV